MESQGSGGKGGDPYFKKCTKTLIKFEKQFKNVLKP